MGLPYQHPVTGESTYYRQNNAITHPIWTTVNAKSIQDTHRVFVEQLYLMQLMII